mgnify:FL=1
MLHPNLKNQNVKNVKNLMPLQTTSYKVKTTCENEEPCMRAFATRHVG